jgi:hypothetical protein
MKRPCNETLSTPALTAARIHTAGAETSELATPTPTSNSEAAVTAIKANAASMMTSGSFRQVAIATPADWRTRIGQEAPMVRLHRSGIGFDPSTFCVRDRASATPF